MLLFAPEPSHEDLRDFMDDEGRHEWDSGTGRQRENISRYLTAVWQSIPDPSEAQLQQLMRPEDWQICQSAPRNRDGILNFYRRKWKRDRKTAAVAKFSERIQGKTIERKPTKLPSKLRDPQDEAHTAAVLRREKARQERFERSQKERQESGSSAERPIYRGPTQGGVGSSEMFAQPPASDRNKIIGAIFLATVALAASIVTAYQQAGVISVLLAHAILVVGWFGFVGSIYFLEHALSLSKRKRLKVTIWAAVISGMFMFGMDRLMVYLKAEQSVEAVATPTLSPSPKIERAQIASPTVTPTPLLKTTPSAEPSIDPAFTRPLPGSTVASVRPSDAPLSALAGIPFKSGSPQRLALLMKNAGYDGSTAMSVLIVGNDGNNVNEIWVGTEPKVTEKLSWRLDGGAYFNFPGGEDTARVYVRSAKDGKIDVTYRPR